jgi:hypothetical protein
MMQVLFRNVGEETRWSDKFITRLSVVWDGKEYQKNPKCDAYGKSEGPPFSPASSWGIPFSPFDFLIPQEALSSGWHTVAVRLDRLAVESNKVSIFIEPQRLIPTAPL